MANVRVREAADYLGVSKSFLDKARCYGGGPVFARLGVAVVYSTEDLDRWLASRKAANDNNAATKAA